MIGFIALLAAGSTLGFDTGNTLYNKCLSSAPIDEAYCLSYISGVSDMMIEAQRAKIMKEVYCPNTAVTRQQLIDITVKALRDDPATRNQPAAGLVAAGLMTALPCGDVSK